jgi:hypothetical protein
MNINIDAKYEETVSPETIIMRLHKALYLSAVKMKELAIRNAPVDIGLLRLSIDLEPNFMYSNVYYVSANASYASAMEYGTRAHWVPIAPLLEWAKRHDGDKNFAYAVRAKIHEHGVNAHPFFRPAIKEVRDIWVPYYFKKVGVANE